MKPKGKNDAHQRFDNGRLSRLLNLIVPDRYIASIYLVFLAFLALYIFFKFVIHPKPEPDSSDEINYISYERYTGETRGDIVLINEAIPNISMPKTIYRGHRYKVFVVFRTYHKDGTHYITAHPSNYRYASGGVSISIPGKEIDGPSIICVGRNTYAFMNAPHVEHDGFLHLGQTENNKIKRIGVFEADLDTSLYSTDCQPPDKATIDRLSALFNVRMSAAMHSED